MNRKGKTIFVSDISLTLKWEGSVGDEQSNGTVEVTDVITDDTDPYSVSVRSEKDNVSNAPVRELLRKELGQVLRPIVEKIIAMAKESITIQSPVVVNKVTTLDSPVVVRSSSTPVSSSTTSVKPVSQSGSTVKKSTRSLKQVLIFDVPPPPLYESFIDAGRYVFFQFRFKP
eukprot:TRINITY_DN1444_c0_g1_i12.p1 TRINITY_DN1444_c0_g1~~TRINITY_DN1444_c0_g1_i12.p1  ORF type:complete len:172 (+),score=26.00 TRINITY_DN1444_c0_g1_i12:328-843(+)